MKSLKLIATLCFVSGTLMAQRNIVASNPVVITGKLIQNRPDPNWKNVKARDEKGIIGREDGLDNNEYEPKAIFNGFAKDKDPVVQTSAGGPIADINTGFNGLGYTQVCPADPTVAAGPNHVLQMINGASGAYFQVWNKSGTTVVPKTYMDAITNKGGLGDPVVLYDQLADRFVMTEFAHKSETGTEGLIIAISKTSIPGGTPADWYVYYFSSTLFPDYPKFAIWGDAYYCKTNDFRSQRYNGASIWAFDRAKMLAGNASATVQKFAMGTSNKYYTMCPVGLSGTTQAPAGTGGLFAYLNDNSWSGSASDSVGLLECQVNFTTPGLSKVVVVKSLAVSAYALGSGTAPQPNGGQGLDVLRNRVMNQPQYRNFGSYSSIVLTHVADVTLGGKAIASPRWYELRSSGTWSVYQSGTFAPSADYRFMPSININSAGEIGMVYNVSSATVFPSVRFAYRKSTDPLGTMAAEGIIKAGTASSSCSGRYGDYNHTVIDPSNNTTFWATGMYNSASSWSTFVASFNTSGSVGPLPVIASSLPLSIEANELTASVHPNPATKQLVLTINQEAKMKMMDFNGKAVMAKNLQAGANKLDISAMAPGVYIIRLNSRNKESVVKFVKE
jgi:hypothetical protein